MVKQGIYLFIVSLMLISCEDSNSNLDTTNSNGTSSGYLYSGLIRQISTKTATSYDDDALTRIKQDCGSEENGLIILNGSDEDADDILEYGEAIKNGTVSVLCNGQDGQIVANTSDIFSDEIFKECSNDNGLAFSVAFDSDKNGELTENEVTKNNYRVICETQNAMFEIKHYVYNSTLTITSGQSTEKVYFYYPKVTEIPESSTENCVGTGGVLIEMITPKDFDDKQPDDLAENSNILSQAICNGADGITPLILPIESNITKDSNLKCEKSGGMKISLAGEDSYICNGETGSFNTDLNLSVKKDANGVAYIYNGLAKISEPIDFTTLNLGDTPVQTLVTKKDSSFACPYGELNITTYEDKNFDHKMNVGDIITASEIVCSAEPKSTTALKVESATVQSSQLTIDFKFNRFINPVTVDRNTVIFVCSSQSATKQDIIGEVDYVTDLTVDGSKDFSFTYLKANLPTPTSDLDCTFKISKFIEDIDGSSMQDSFLKEFNLTVN